MHELGPERWPARGQDRHLLAPRIDEGPARQHLPFVKAIVEPLADLFRRKGLMLIPILALTLVGQSTALAYAMMCAVIFGAFATSGTTNVMPAETLLPLRLVCLVGLSVLMILLVLAYEFAKE